jgi:threonyl-tRNA synthetase
MQKIPYIINVGEKEVESKNIAVRSRGNKVEFGVNIQDFIREVLKEIGEYK